ncbi:MAG TPA: phosphoribosyltransferase family protein [Pyrinomonadaceae bacterium]|nr:phosphoribosyltransferase family protein [Pyrinomonadaceae bacterium]
MKAGRWRFADAREAGRALASRLGAYTATDDLIVVGLASGGVPVAAEVARGLGAPLDVLLIRRLLVPRGLESQVCAVNACGKLFVDEGLPPRSDAPETPLEHFISDALADFAERASACRGDRPALDLKGRTVLLVDNGIRTGLTLLAGVRALRAAGAVRVVAAVPVAAPESRAVAEAACDALVCLAWPEPFGHVGLWYGDFARPDAAQIRELLAESERVRLA